jgi:hypothetical protein
LQLAENYLDEGTLSADARVHRAAGVASDVIDTTGPQRCVEPMRYLSGHCSLSDSTLDASGAAVRTLQERVNWPRTSGSQRLSAQRWDSPGVERRGHMGEIANPGQTPGLMQWMSQGSTLP